jgi:hypothetical protein
MTSVRPLALAVLALLATPPARADDGFRCDGGLVGVGDLTLDLLGKCGAPSLRERWTEARDAVAVDTRQGFAQAERLTTEVEQWTYDFGPSRFMQLVTVHNGRVVRVEQGGYGHGLPPVEAPRPRVSSCEPSALKVGDTKADALARCGEPASIHAWQGPRTTAVVLTPTALAAEALPPRPARIEQWVYNLGPSWFVRIVRFEDGRVTRIDTGGKGYGG